MGLETPSNSAAERVEELDDEFLLGGGEGEEGVGRGCRGGAEAGVEVDDLGHAVGEGAAGDAAVMPERVAEAEAPERRCANFGGAGIALGDEVGIDAHVVEKEVGIGLDGAVAEGRGMLSSSPVT